MSKETVTKQTTPWALIMTFILLVIKIVWVPTLSWWIVFAPVLIVAGIVGIVFLFILVLGIAVYFLDR